MTMCGRPSEGLCVDSAGNVYLADTQNDRIRKINTQGIITTVAGDATGGFTGDGVQATATSLFYPSDVALDSKGNLYISDALNGRLRMVNASGIISTVAGGGTSLLDGGALQESLAPTGITLDASGIFAVNAVPASEREGGEAPQCDFTGSIRYGRVHPADFMRQDLHHTKRLPADGSPMQYTG